MKAIDFVVRDGAGALQRGVVPEDGNTSIGLTSGQEISLNLRQIDLAGQQRIGNDLVITLVDGRTVTLENYFNDVGETNRLFISADGYLNEVAFVETTDGELFAQFGPTEQWGKWSPSDDLIYLGRTEVAQIGAPVGGDEEVSMLGAALLGGGGLAGLGAGAAAVGGAALVAGGGGGGGGGGNPPAPPADPTVDGVGTTTDVGGDDTTTHTVTVTGTGEPGDTVEVDAGGETVTTVIGDDGTWETVFEGDTFPPDGTIVPVVVVTHPDGTETTLTGPEFVIDTVGPAVSIDTGVESVGHVVNEEELAGGVTLTGTGEAGATLEITIEGVTQTTIVEDDGTWAATWEPGTLPEGEYGTGVTIVASDSFGNTTTVTDQLVVDTIAELTINTATVEGDGTVNAAEASDGITLTGTAQAGSSVEVTFNGVTQTATVAADGSWTVDFAAGDIPSGETEVTVSAVATDAAGNTTTASGTIMVDTVTEVTINTAGIEGDGVINAAEAADGVTLTGTAQAGASVDVTFNGVTRTTTADADGNWSADFTAAEIPTGETDVTITAVATDLAGNTATATGIVMVDTVTEVTIATGAVEGDGTVNAAEAADGITLTGTAQAGATVAVTFNGITRDATVDANGNWSATYTAAEVPTGETQATVTAVSTDAAGNSATAAGTVNIDTVTDVTVNTANVEGDGVVNAAEAADGISLTGTAQPGSSVEVTFNGVTRTATVDASGNWTADFLASEIPSGETQASVTAVATDAAGNTATATGTVDVDTLVNALGFTSTAGGADATLNATEAASGLVVTGVTEPGSTVVVQLGNATSTAIVAADGTWTASFASGAIPQGTYTTELVASATDAAGNTRETTQSVSVDTEASVLTLDGPVEGDDIINGAEASDGVVLSGTADPGATVSVTLGGVTHQVVANGNGVWQAFYTAAEITPGTYDADITATTTDAAGNVATVTDTVHVDTRVDNLSVAADVIEGDNVISEAERVDGVVLTGTTEPGSSVTVTLGTETVQAIVDANGNWQAPFAASQVPQGEYVTDVSVTATDVAGNVATVTDTVRVDTLVNQLDIQDTVTSDDVISGPEARDGIALGGQVEPGSTVMVDFNGTVLAATVDAAGNWSLDIPPSAIPPGEYDAAITVMATDSVGNTETLADTLRIDTEAPEGPVIASFTRDGDGIRGISTDQSEGDLAVAQVNGDGSVTEVAATQVDIDVLNETNFQFQTNVPDGSHLVVTSEDAAGNTRGTYVVLDDESANSSVDLSNPALGNYQIEAVELQFAEEANLTITEAQLVGLSDSTNTLTIHGGSDDTVTIAGANLTGTTNVDGQTYDVYSLGTEGTVILDDDITVNTAIG
ncbi:Ig-like domain-containing protein [uncultured Tateyamaria sp.]|uniref:Ig-like domain-containing protein n=1 Tax=uncultured Tateyamaria sp. TaxID=455651 RepID=UPI002614CBF7|nr:Ig-like domain-containing protein [uncultured Tateyamaria sp.]